MHQPQAVGGAAVQARLCIRHLPVQRAAGGHLAGGAWLRLATCTHTKAGVFPRLAVMLRIDRTVSKL